MAVVVIMFSLGLGLAPSDFRRIARRRRAFCIGALSQIVLLPLPAYGIILTFGFKAETAVGLMILAACPGGAASNMITELADCDVALSVTMTAAFSLSCVLIIPLILDFAVSRFMGAEAPDVDIAATAFTAFALSALPILAGVILRAAASGVSEAITPPVAKAAVMLFIGVIAGAIVSNWQVEADNFATLGAGLPALVALLSAGAFLVSRALRASDRETKIIAIETGVQNGALALAIAGLIVANDLVFNAYAVPAALYSVVWLGIAMPSFLFLARRARLIALRAT